MNKICTSLEQSKKLVELGIDASTADMNWEYDHNNHTFNDTPKVLAIRNWDDPYNKNIPAWSLAALLDVLELPTLEKGNIGKDKTGWMVTIYPNNHRYDSSWHDNQIDACYEMILKLNELKLL